MWAGDHVLLGPPLTKSGLFNTTGSRYLEEPIDALDDDRVRQINIRGPVRGAKSLILDVWTPEVIARRPGPMMWVMETDDMVTDHVNARVLPVLKRCEPAARFLPSDPRKITPAGVVMTHGMQLFFNGPSLSNAQNKTIQYMIIDEVWRFAAGVVGEFKGRLGDYEKEHRSKLVLTSQGGEEDSDWAIEFDRGVLNTWSVPCLGCGGLMSLEWSVAKEGGTFAGMRWDEHKDESGLWIVQRCLPSIRYECPQCGHEHRYNAQTISEWDRLGRYVKGSAIDKNPAIQSYEYNAIVTRPWGLLVEQFLHAINALKRGGYLPIVEFYQKRMAKNKSESSFALSRAAVIRTMEYKADESWPDEQARFMSVDCQKDFEDFWLVLRAYGKAMESRLICWKRCKSWDEVAAVAAEHNVRPECVFVDVAYTHKTAIAEVAKRNWTGLWGQDASIFTHTTNGKQEDRIYSQMKQSETGGVYFFWAKRTVADFFDQLKRGKVGAWAAGVNAGQVYSDHLNAQYKKPFVNAKTGMTEWKWVLRKHMADDHLLDCERMQVVAASMGGVLDDTIFAAPEQPTEEKAKE